MMSKCVIYFLFLPFLTFSQSQKGYFLYEKVVPFHPEYQLTKNDSVLKKEIYDEALQVMIKEFEKYIDNWSSRKFDSLEIRHRQKELQYRQKLIQNFDEYSINVAKKDFLENEISLKKHLLFELKAFCNENQIECIIDKKNLIYCDNCFDFTEKFSNFLKLKYPPIPEIKSFQKVKLELQSSKKVKKKLFQKKNNNQNSVNFSSTKWHE